MRFNENRLSGSIPSQIFAASRIQELNLQSNFFTGTIPREIGILENATTILLDHNLLKGSIPKELQFLHRIEFLHLHRNQLTGIAPDVSFAIKSNINYISDCGEPNFLLASELTCDTCTMCCNSEKKCQETENWTVPVEGSIILTLALIPVLITFNFVLFKATKNNFFSCFVDRRDPSTIYNNDSIYCFLLSNSYVAKMIHLITAGIQIWLYTFYLAASNVRNPDTDWRFSFRCLANSMSCVDDSSVHAEGWFVFCAVLVLHLGADVVMGILQIRKAVMLLDFHLFVSGITMFSLTSFGGLTSYYYNVALAESNTDLISNAVILLFINDLDEKFLILLQIVAPDWTKNLLDEVHINMSNKAVSNEETNMHDSISPSEIFSSHSSDETLPVASMDRSESARANIKLGGFLSKSSIKRKEKK